jgi:predicted nucleic acid-binding protein
MVETGTSRHIGPEDVKDTPILRASLHAGVDYLATNDHHLLALDPYPYEGLRIVSMTEFHRILVSEGLIRPTV